MYYDYYYDYYHNYNPYWPDRYYRPYHPYYPSYYAGVYQNLYNSGYMNDVWQYASINNWGSKPAPSKKTNKRK